MEQQRTRTSTQNSEDAGMGHQASNDSMEGAEGKETDEKSGFKQKLKSWWTSLGLDAPTLMTMFKAAVAPTIATAFFQADAVAAEYSTLGYLLCIVTILAFPIFPRAKFFQSLILSLVAVCLGAALSIFALWTALKARQHTRPADSSPTGYNSSAAAVCGIWLFIFIWGVSVTKAAQPQFNFPAILVSIFMIVSMTYGPEFYSIAIIESFIRRLLVTFLSGFALATGVHLFIFPVTSRTVVFKEITGCFQAVQGVLNAQTIYMQSMEDQDMFIAPPPTPKEGEDTTTRSHFHRKHHAKTIKQPQQPLAPQATALKGAARGLVALYGKLHGDLAFAKREVAYGKLDAEDISDIFKMIRAILLPVTGLSSIIDLFERVSADRGWDKPREEGVPIDPSEQRAVQDWQNIMKTLHGSFNDMTQLMDQGIDHILLSLELVKPPKKSKKTADTAGADVEAKGDMMHPGEHGFSAYMDKKIVAFYETRKVTLHEWCMQRGIDVPQSESGKNDDYQNRFDEMGNDEHARKQRQLFGVLYMEWLLYCASRSVYDVVLWADKKVEDGTMQKKHLILPGLRRTRKWIMSVLSKEDSSDEYHQAMSGSDDQHGIDLGDAYSARRDPEHLPPETTLERMGDYLRQIPRLFRSKHSAFGFRVACAAMSVAIVAFLRDSYSFFIRHRLIWAVIMIVFSMTRTAGQSVFTFILRVGGTAIAMVGAYICWYIVDGRTAGVIVFQFLWIAGSYWVVVKKPKYVVAGIISAVTTLLILSYELQVRKLGVALAESSGQPAYPIYVLAPYRLATVAGGIFVAYIWTVFPYPASEQSELRSSLAGTLYLLANYYSIMHETVRARIRGDEGDPEDKASPGRRLEKARNEVFAKSQALMTNLKGSSEFAHWQIRVGGKFPHQTYDAIISHAENVLNYTGLLGFASRSFSAETSDSVWADHFKQLLTTVNTTSHDITSTLSLLSNSIATGQPLPPYLKTPEPFRLARKLEEMDRDIMSVRHIDEPGYAAFAVVQIASKCIVQDIDKLIGLVKSLVGELDFSFHAVSTSSASSIRSADGATLAPSSSSQSEGSNSKGKKE